MTHGLTVSISDMARRLRRKIISNFVADHASRATTGHAQFWGLVVSLAAVSSTFSIIVKLLLSALALLTRWVRVHGDRCLLFR